MTHTSLLKSFRSWVRPFALVLVATAPCLSSEKIDYGRQIQPILARKCYACHGPDEENREADLRLDVRESAVDSGAIAPGNPQDSDVVRRILSDDPDEQMPPPDARDSLSPEETALLEQWIQSGAEYRLHWSFVPPKRPHLPALRPKHADAAWRQNPIDLFVLRRLHGAGLKPAVPANRYALVRRVYLDLTGIAPTPQQADTFVNSSAPDAYEQLVDQLLASEQYGEYWARQWLDLARYADTNGYEKDRPRSIWPYRDWVIEALNADMPYDQFTIEQLAGDMLPHATNQQRIATGFHRNTMLNEEGGIDPLEYRFHAMVDRVATTGLVWLGLTTGCAQCHSHKYDPISHSDYYRLLALLNNADEPDLAVQDAAILERRAVIEARIRELQNQLPAQFPPPVGEQDTADSRRRHFERRFATWIETESARAANWVTPRPQALLTNLPRLQLLPDGSVLSTGDITKRDVFDITIPLKKQDFGTPASKARVPDTITAIRLEVLPDKRLPAGGPGRAYYEGRKGDFFLSEVSATWNGKAIQFRSPSHSYGKISIGSGNAKASNVLDGDASTGWSTSGKEGQEHQLVLNLANPLKTAGQLQIRLLFERHFAASLGRFRLSMTGSTTVVQARQLPAAIEHVLTRRPASWKPEERAQVLRHFVSVVPELANARKPVLALRRQLPALPETMVMLERDRDHPRKSYRHHRGEYTQRREEVRPGVPTMFAPIPDTVPQNRLNFARWLVSERNPLAARVAANRAWRAFFGAGLVRTSGDFGTQSEPPTHPELLDWLATELVERRWSQKHLHRLITTSATYRQDARVTPRLLRTDPKNRLLARGPRQRMTAEMVRDTMLHASGLLSRITGGPSVYPPQPASVTALAYGATKWNPSPGANRYRRSLYTFSKRTAPFAAYTVFDGPTGENCIARRNQSNTPLQALTLLNDPMYLELARATAAATRQPALPAARTPDNPFKRATRIFRRFLTRPPEEAELAAIVDFFERQRMRFQGGELDAATVLSLPKQETTNDSSHFAEEAAWVMVSRAVMNLDEAITR